MKEAAKPVESEESGPRLDKWLWFARFFKSRSLASKVCAAGKVRIEGLEVVKTHHKIRVGEILTFPQGRHIRVVKVLALGSRRGPAEEAQELYEDLKPPEAENRLPKGAGLETAALREAGAGRPTKKERRALEKFVAGEGEG